MRHLYALATALLCAFSSFAQHNDNVWLIGYGGPPSGDDFGISMLRFDDGNVKVLEVPMGYYEFYLNTCVFSDSTGKLFAYFNGFDLQNAAHKIMQNGKGFDVEIEENFQYYSDDAVVQGSLFLEWPNHPDSVLFLYIGQAYIEGGIGYVSKNFSYALIDQKANNGLGKVILREQDILMDTIAYGHTTIVKHANGRDWWVPIREANSNRVYYFLVTPNGIKQVKRQTISFPSFNGAGQSVFSPDGRHFATFNGISDKKGAYLDVFDFDRCAGYLSNQRQLVFQTGKPGGVAFSPNSRYLYMTIRDTLIQYDMDAPDLEASRKTIAVRESSGGLFQATYFSAQLAPDQRIYISATNGIQYLHVIDNPDEAGASCGFREKGLKLPTYNQSSMPNFPNYRLGPLDGSPCDTLGLDNHPVAWYRYTQDTLNPLSVAFHDLSYYEPTKWAWDFGDGKGSSQRHPTHTYATKGVYEVCLTASNSNSSSTHCKKILQGVSKTEEPEAESGLQVGPNPFDGRIVVALSASISGARYQLFDQLGRMVLSTRIQQGINEIDASALPTGMYFWEVVARNEPVGNGKLVKVRF